MIKVLKIFMFSMMLMLSSCQGMKDALSGRQQDNSDEFLIKKKNPLVIPPEFGKLPEPKENTLDEEEVAEDEIETLLGAIDDSNDGQSETELGSLEDFIREELSKD